MVLFLCLVQDETGSSRWLFLARFTCLTITSSFSQLGTLMLEWAFTWVTVVVTQSCIIGLLQAPAQGILFLCRLATSGRVPVALCCQELIFPASATGLISGKLTCFQLEAQF